MSQENPTLGESRVRISFNVGGNVDVEHIKRVCADMIDFLEGKRTEAGPSEKNRTISQAQTWFEDAAMHGVKAVTA